jgi:hypothetical protein
MRRWVAVITAGALLAAACSAGDDGSGTPAATGDGAPPRASATTTVRAGLTVTALSARPEMVSGGDVLVEVAGVGAGDDLAVTVGGRDVSAAFTGGVGLVTDLPLGESTIEARSGDARGSLTVTNHPIVGPIFSGPHLEPFVCTTQENGLGPPTDGDCSADTVVRWSYVATDDSVKPLDDPARLPGDVATTEIDGREVPLVVRTESGTIDRGVYWIHVLDPDPAAVAWDPSAWNGTLVYRFGGGCGTTYSQGSVLGDTGSVAGAFLDVSLLRLGYAQATNTLNTFQVQCNDVLSAEAAMMTKERFAEAFGIPNHTVGEGASGGAIQQYLIAQNYPGILDAIVAALPFPDALSIAPGVVDCGLLEHFYTTPAGAPFSPEQRAAVNGHLVAGTCTAWANTFLAAIDPTRGCSLPPEEVYDPKSNRSGARCTLPDSIVNLVGIDPGTGFARRPLDNVGVQYGLEALRSGTITVDQFLDLNAAIGGYDIDGRIVPERMVADPDDIALIWRTGRIQVGGGDLRRIPVLTLNLYTDPIGDIHDRFRAFTVLDRLALADGARAPNAVLWTYPGGDDLVASLLGATGRDTRVELVGLAVEWLDALDALGVATEERTPDDLAATRPAGAADVCVLPDGERLTGGDELYGDGAPCAVAYPARGDPRTAAGGPRHGLAGKCALVEVDPSSYGVAFTAEQEARLRGVFPDGVCDHGAPSEGTAALLGTWLDYSDGPPG